MSSHTTLSFSLSPLSPTLENQLLSQGYQAADDRELKALQFDLSAILRLSVRGLITDSASQIARGKLMKQIEKLVVVPITEV